MFDDTRYAHNKTQKIHDYVAFYDIARLMVTG